MHMMNTLNRNAIGVIRSQPIIQTQMPAQPYVMYGQPVHYVPINPPLSPSAYQLPMQAIQRK